MYNGAVDDENDINHNSPELHGHSRKKVEQDNFKEIQLRFLTFEEKNKRRIEADIKHKNAKNKKNMIKWIPCLKCYR